MCFYFLAAGRHLVMYTHVQVTFKPVRYIIIQHTRGYCVIHNLYNTMYIGTAAAAVGRRCTSLVGFQRGKRNILFVYTCDVRLRVCNILRTSVDMRDNAKSEIFSFPDGSAGIKCVFNAPCIIFSRVNR